MSAIFSAHELVYFAEEATAGLGLFKWTGKPAAATLHSINPLAADWSINANKCANRPVIPRFSLNVTEFRNFVFESDKLTLPEQLGEWIKIAELLPIKQLTYSGGKSYHAVVSVMDTLPFEPHTDEGVASYKSAWKALATFIQTNSTLVLDESTKDPARLTRVPGALRVNVLQASIDLPLARFITAAEVMEIMGQYARPRTEGTVRPAHLGQTSSNDLDKLLKIHKHRHLAHKVNQAERWASTENMYPALLKLTLWAIDELNPEPAAWLALLETKVFPKIAATGYNRDLTLPVKLAYNYKGHRI